MSRDPTLTVKATNVMALPCIARTYTDANFLLSPLLHPSYPRRTATVPIFQLRKERPRERTVTDELVAECRKDPGRSGSRIPAHSLQGLEGFSEQLVEAETERPWAQGCPIPPVHQHPLSGPWASGVPAGGKGEKGRDASPLGAFKRLCGHLSVPTSVSSLFCLPPPSPRSPGQPPVPSQWKGEG